MTKLEAAKKLVVMHAECEARLRNAGRTMPAEYAEAVAIACMALKEEDNND